MDKGALLAITGSVTVFLIVLAVIFYSHADFDQQLIEQVDNGVPAEKLIPQIDKENKKLMIGAQNSLGSKIVNKDSEKGNIISRSDYEYYMQTYQNEIKMISEYDAARKKFARREITKEQFLQEIKNLKDMIETFN
jgi:hypothetical protein